MPPRLLSVPPIDGECVTSLASRLAARNKPVRALSFCTEMGVSLKQLTNGDEASLRRIAGLAGHDAERLGFHTPTLENDTQGGKIFRLGHETIKFSVLRRTQIRICPLCCHEHGPHQKGIWQVEQIRTCHIHNCLLISLPRSSYSIDHSDVVQLAPPIQTLPIHPVPETDLTFEHMLAKRIFAPDAKPKEWLDDHPFHVAALVPEAFGLLLLKGPKSIRLETTDQDWQRAGHLGYQTLKTTPEDLDLAMTQIENAHPFRSPHYHARFQVFFEWLRDRRDDPAFDPFRDRVRLFIRRNYPVRKGNLILGDPNPEQLVYDVKSIRARWRIGLMLIAHELKTQGYIADANGISEAVGLYSKVFCLTENSFK